MVRVAISGVLVAATVAACGDNRLIPDAAPVVPVFRNPVALPDDELAQQALQVLGAQVAGAQPEACNVCHGLTSQHLRYWGRLSDTALASCFTDLAVTSQASALAMIDCMRAMPATPTSDFDTRNVGIFATAAELPWFAYTFAKAYGADAPIQLAAFEALAGMPRAQVPALTQAQFDLVAEWFVRGLPALDQTLVVDPPPTTCQPAIASAVADHVTLMATQGWQALDAQSSLAMFGCGAATDPHLCLATTPLAIDQPYGAGWEVSGRGRLRVLGDMTYVTSYWTRSSADGRFVAHGVANVPGSYVRDLQRDQVIPIAADYDPAFFPDNSGFVFQGGVQNTCAQSVLTSNPSSIAMTEPGCSAVSAIGLYEYVGKLLGGGDYIALDSSFVSDDGGKLPTHADPNASFVSAARATFTPMIFAGSAYVPQAAVEIATPFEGDAVLSPSSTLLLTRLSGPNDHQLGYVLHEVDATLAGATYTIATPELARYCVTGGKPAFSYDERWIVFHHYVGVADAVELGFSGPGDPAFSSYLSKGAANLYLMQIATGVAVRLTYMQPGQYALFPHFRADGWIYAQVRDANTGHEYTIASDAAL